MSLHRLTIPIFIASLAILVAVMAQYLWRNLEALSTAADDNTQWTILQLDTEFANLNAVLLEAAANPDVSRNEIRLRTDITLSRITIVSAGWAGEILRSDPTATELLEQIALFSEQAPALIDGDLDAEDLARLRELTATKAPLARSLALRGLQLGAERTEARRREFANKLRNTGLVAIVVIGALAAVLVLLNRSLEIAREKDRDLRASSKRFESTITGSLDAIITSTEEGRILDFNPAAETVFGWRKSDITGRKVGILLPSDLADDEDGADQTVENAFCRYLGQGRCEIEARRSNGETFPADLTVTVANGDPNSLVPNSLVPNSLVIVYLRDISDRKVNEQALINAKERAERTDRAKTQFLTVMSHEMRTPLNGVMGVLDLLRTTKLSARQRRFVDVAAASSEVLMQHLYEALDITRIETGSLTLAPQRFNLADEVERIATVLEPLAEEKGIALNHCVDPSMRGYFVADGKRVGQIITNLIGNAIKFTDHGAVDIRVTGLHTQSMTSATISVSDTGIGISEQHKEAIFEDFVALSHSSGRMSRGDGLGLSISRKIARLMGGDVTVTSVEGQGSEFKLTLPLDRAVDTGATGVGDLHAALPLGETAKDILVVEDNTINRTVLQEMLSGMGHAVTTAANGQEGFDRAQERPFDLIFMDINMPDIDGIDLTKKIRGTRGPNQSAHIQGLTAYGREEYLQIAQDAGMDGFSTKPIRMRDIERVLREEQGAVQKASDTSDVIDMVIFSELQTALGAGLLKKNADNFFAETDNVLGQMKHLALPDDGDDIASHLHNIGGAAALFGLRALSDAVLAMRTEVEGTPDRPLDTMLSELDASVKTARSSYLELTE